MKQLPNELLVPPKAQSDTQAREMLRAWVAGGGLHCVLNVGTWHTDTEIDERSAWGIMLADVARHISNALEDEFGLDHRESLKLVVESFNSEIRKVTSAHSGSWPDATDFASDHIDDE